MDKKAVLRAMRNALLIIVALIAMVWARTYYSGRAQFMEGEKNFAAGNFKDAITNYETAIHMYAPFAGYVPASAQRLWDIGEGYERNGEYDWALISYRALRSSFYAVRSFYTPYRDWIDRSEKRIDDVLALQRGKEAAAKAGKSAP